MQPDKNLISKSTGPRALALYPKQIDAKGLGRKIHYLLLGSYGLFLTMIVVYAACAVTYMKNKEEFSGQRYLLGGSAVLGAAAVDLLTRANNHKAVLFRYLEEREKYWWAIGVRPNFTGPAA